MLNGRKSWSALRRFRQAVQFASDGAARGVLRGRFGMFGGLFQPSNYTSMDRYPRIFAFVRSALADCSEPRILSFGCSTGEEVFTLRNYFPTAHIKGVDVNPGNIATCRKRLATADDGRIHFAVANSTGLEADASYDAIFCMAVFQHGALHRKGLTNCEHLIRFDAFAERLADMARCLKPSGLLVVRQSNFRLCDTPASILFEPIFGLPVPYRWRIPLYGPDNALIACEQYSETVFRKRTGWQPHATLRSHVRI
jgi:ubiquinone/menaquinone biosynthesis C-methylase UbiE